MEGEQQSESMNFLVLEELPQELTPLKIAQTINELLQKQRRRGSESAQFNLYIYQKIAKLVGKTDKRYLFNQARKLFGSINSENQKTANALLLGLGIDNIVQGIFAARMAFEDLGSNEKFTTQEELKLIRPGRRKMLRVLKNLGREKDPAKKAGDTIFRLYIKTFQAGLKLVSKKTGVNFNTSAMRPRFNRHAYQLLSTVFSPAPPQKFKLSVG